MELSYDGNESEVLSTDEKEIEKEEETSGRGVKENLTEFKKTLSQQFFETANFLTPHPSMHGDHLFCHDPNGSGLRNPANSYFIYQAPNYPYTLDDAVDLNDDSEDERRSSEPCCVGITDEVLTFAETIAMHPETWLDFPLEEDNVEDFDMSEVQLKHAFTVEQYAPRLAALRIELCPHHMNESYFWMVYFVLLHSRLSKQDAESLYTQQVKEAKTKMMDELHAQTKPEDHWDETTQEHCVDKSVINEKLALKSGAKDLTVGQSKVVADVDDDDGWLEEDSDLGSCYRGSFSVGNGDEISFSDLEED